MGETYFNLKHKLEQLGYTSTFPREAVKLVDCLVSDLMQTTRSLQHYMELAKEALAQKDSMALDHEPYKTENAKLIKENNELHKEIMTIKEENVKISKETKRKIKLLSDTIAKKEALINKLQHDVKELSMRGLCSSTLSSRNKRKESVDQPPKPCSSREENTAYLEQSIIELRDTVQNLQEINGKYCDEIVLLKSQVENRDCEIMRLTIQLEEEKPLKRGFGSTNTKLHDLEKQLYTANHTIEGLKKEIENVLKKQHEAMNRALSLADKNKLLEDELKKVDLLALKVEENCNKRILELQNQNSALLCKIDLVSTSNIEQNKDSLTYQFLQDSLIKVKEEKAMLQKEITDLMELNKNLQEKIMSFTMANADFNSRRKETEDLLTSASQCPTKKDIQEMLQSERKVYEKYMRNIQEKLNETISIFNNHNSICSIGKKCPHASYDNKLVNDMHVKLCDSEQKLLMLKKENEDLQSKIVSQDDSCKQNYKDVINQLNSENGELTNENIRLSQKLSQYQSLNSCKSYDTNDIYKKENKLLKDELNKLKNDLAISQKDKHEYKLRNKDLIASIDKLKHDIILKQRDIDLINDENSSFKRTQRTGKASSDRLKEECNFLKEQIKILQDDLIRQKSIANQIKNIQIETERSSSEMQNEVLLLQKKLSLSNDTITSLEKKSKEYEVEILGLKSEKCNLIDNIKRIDQERDKLVIDLDNKTETICVLEQKIKSQLNDINKLEDELIEYKRKFNVNRIAEHKLVDSETQLRFLNGEISRLTHMYDNALVENKHLQNSLADANGALKLSKIEQAQTRKEVEELKQQLQHYVTEIRRIEEMLSLKEAERSDMLEHFASLSVEANILENTNQSLESESASKSLQMQNYISKIQNLEVTLLDKENIIEKQTARISELLCKVSNLEREVNLVSEEKILLEQNAAHLKQMCKNNLQSDQRTLEETDTEFKLYENRIKSLSLNKRKLEEENDRLKLNLETTEKLLSNARKEIVELKLALQDATSETKSLNEHINKMNRIETEIHESTMTRELEFPVSRQLELPLSRELELPLHLQETIHEVSHEEDDDDSSRYQSTRRKRLTRSRYTRGSTL